MINQPTSISKAQINLLAHQILLVSDLDVTSESIGNDVLVNKNESTLKFRRPISKVAYIVNSQACRGEKSIVMVTMNRKNR